MQDYEFNFNGFSRRLPFIKAESGIYLVDNESLCFGNDIKFTELAAVELVKLIRPFEPEILVTIEAKPIALGYEICKHLGIKDMVVARKTDKACDMGDIQENISSITGGDHTIKLRSYQVELLRGKRAVLFDDVVSTGSTMAGLRSLTRKAGAEVICVASVWVEGCSYLPFFQEEIKTGKFINLFNLPVLKKTLNGQIK
jgi:adenine phosphoribosyltransferase